MRFAFPGKGIYYNAVKNDVVEVQVKGVLPTTTGCAVFVGNDEKTFVIYVDHSVGAAITMFLRNTPKERPLTHDLIGHIFTGLGVKVERIVINDLKNSTYYARLVLRSENELGKKILEIGGIGGCPGLGSGEDLCEDDDPASLLHREKTGSIIQR